MISVTINGERREIPEGLTVTQLIEHLGMPADRIAMERNLDVLPRAQWPATKVAAGDNFEIVHLVGGGQGISPQEQESRRSHRPPAFSRLIAVPAI